MDSSARLTITKQPDGRYRASRDGREVVVTLGQEMGDPDVDAKRAVLDALEALDGSEAETRAALVDWKCDGYALLLAASPKNERLQQKHAYWVSEQDRLNTERGR